MQMGTKKHLNNQSQQSPEGGRKQTMKICIFSPAFNTKGTLPRLIEEANDVAATLASHGHKLQMLIINDNSNDGTAELLNLAAGKFDWLSVLHNSENKGNAGNILAGYRWGVERGSDITGCCDTDGEHSLYAFLRHLRMIEDGLCDGVSGSIIFPDHDANHHDRNMMRFWGGMQAAMAGIDGMFYIQSPGHNLHRSDKVAKALELFEKYQAFFYAESFPELTGDDLEEKIAAVKGTKDDPFPRWGMHGVMIHLLAKGAGAKIKAAYLECFGKSPNRTPGKLFLQANAANVHAGMLQKFMAELQK